MPYPILTQRAQSIAELCARFGVLRLEAFGTAASDAFRPGESDISLRKLLARMCRCMSERRPKLLFDAIASIDTAQAFLAGVALGRYETNLMLRSATERQLEI